ncbi:MAG TPA: hypothetical protein VFV51_00790, partial [Vicinamibacterales bacterium]|nr:hypothetical protein [Vicinamibacterales bacterium]
AVEHQFRIGNDLGRSGCGDSDQIIGCLLAHHVGELLQIGLPPASTALKELDTWLISSPPYRVASRTDESGAIDRRGHTTRVEELDAARRERHREFAGTWRLDDKMHTLAPSTEQARGSRAGGTGAENEDLSRS